MKLGRKLAEGIVVEPVIESSVDGVAEPAGTGEPVEAHVIEAPREMITEPVAPIAVR